MIEDGGDTSHFRTRFPARWFSFRLLLVLVFSALSPNVLPVVHGPSRYQATETHGYLMPSSSARSGSRTMHAVYGVKVAIECLLFKLLDSFSYVLLKDA